MSKSRLFPVPLTPPETEPVMDLGPADNQHNRTLVRDWMQTNRWQFTDLCGEINCTKMAEDAADNYNLYEDDIDFKIPEWVFELSAEVGNGND